MDPWVFGSGRMKQELVKAETVDVPEQDLWRVDYLARRLEERQVLHYGVTGKEKKGLQLSLTLYVSTRFHLVIVLLWWHTQNPAST